MSRDIDGLFERLLEHPGHGSRQLLDREQAECRLLIEPGEQVGDPDLDWDDPFGWPNPSPVEHQGQRHANHNHGQCSKQRGLRIEQAPSDAAYGMFCNQGAHNSSLPNKALVMRSRDN